MVDNNNTVQRNAKYDTKFVKNKPFLRKGGKKFNERRDAFDMNEFEDSGNLSQASVRSEINKNSIAVRDKVS